MSPESAKKPYPEVPTQPDFPAIERAILAFWKERNTFETSVEKHAAGEKGEGERVAGGYWPDTCPASGRRCAAWGESVDL